MSKFFTRFCCGFTVVAILFGTFVAGGHFPVFEKHLFPDAEVIVIKQGGSHSKLGITEQQKISVSEIESVVAECAQLTTVTYTSAQVADSEESRYLFDDIAILGTSNSITVTCDDVVSVWYDLDDVTVRIDGEVIYVALPEPQADSHILLDTVEVDEDNCIFNPIDYDQYRNLYSGIEANALENAIDHGIYEQAQTNMESVLRAFIGQITDYEVVFE